jgi:GNAT superfamily N-acetyltransferase
MNISVVQTDLQNILSLRNIFLSENNFQIRYNACHERGWTDSYLIMDNDQAIGYGSIKGKAQLTDRDSVFEFYLLPLYRNRSAAAFSAFLKATAAEYIECQTNETLLSSLLFQFAAEIHADTILFAENYASALRCDKGIFRKIRNAEQVFDHKVEPVGDYLLEINQQIIATGGFLLHYNFPFADLYMEVKQDHRRKGYGSFLIQELKKACYLAGRIPAARCDLHNTASKMTLLKAGLRITGYLLLGKIRH